MESIIITLTTIVAPVVCTIGGLTYMDDMDNKQWYKTPKTPNECNPLYWYPQHIPEHCYITAEKPKPPAGGGFKPLPIPVPIPAPLPPPYPIPPIPVPAPVPIPISIALPPPMYMPPPPMYMPPPPPPPPMPYNPMPVGSPVMPPVPFFPQLPPQYQPPILPRFHGFVPPIPGMVSKDGGINILPFSDVYSDLIERRRRKKIRRKLEEMMTETDYYPKRRKHKKVIPVISYLRSNGKIGNHRVIDFSSSVESAEMY